MLRVAAACAALIGLSAAEAPPAPVLIAGYWYEEGQPDDPNVLTIVHFDATGRFDVHFRSCHGRQQIDDFETGVWTYANSVNDIVTLSTNGHSTYRDDRYDTVSLDNAKYVYRHETTGFVFTDIRIDAKSDVPSCNIGS